MMINVATGIIGKNGQPTIFGHVDDYEDFPTISGELQPNGEWVMRPLEIVSARAASLVEDRPLVLSVLGTVFDGETGQLRYDAQTTSPPGVSFISLLEIWGTGVALGFDVPPIVLREDGARFVDGIPLSPPPGSPSDGGDLLTLEDLQPGLEWASNAIFYFAGTEISGTAFAVTGSSGTVLLFNRDFALDKRVPLNGRETCGITAVHAHTGRNLICFSSDNDKNVTEIFQLNLDTEEVSSLLTVDGISSFGQAAEFQGRLYVPNALPASLGGGMRAGLVVINNENVDDVPGFTLPCLKCIATDAFLWVFAVDSVSRFNGEVWQRFQVPDYQLPDEFK